MKALCQLWYRSKLASRAFWALVAGVWAYLTGTRVPMPWLWVTLWAMLWCWVGGWMRDDAN